MSSRFTSLKTVALSASCLACFLVFLSGQGSRYYLFLSDQRIVTVELISSEQAILNYINLSEGYEVIQAPLLVFLDSEGNRYRGHLIKVEEPSDPDQRFKVSDPIAPGDFRGYDILGDYRFRSPPEKAYFRVGSAILELEPLTQVDFERIAAGIAEVDLSGATRGARRMRTAGFERGYGVLYRAGTELAEAWEKYFPDLEVLQPIILAHPLPRLPPSSAHLPDPVVVNVKAIITRSGGVRDVSVVEEIDRILDQSAVDAVRNRWRFLPAISKGEIAESELTLNVFFRRQRP